MKCIAAYTNPGADYPGYVNVSQDDDGSIVVTTRGDPKKVDGSYLCGYAGDKGQPGRCTPGDSRCNNYCNMAPEKGPMQPHPLPCTLVICGETVSVRITADALAEIIRELTAQ